MESPELQLNDAERAELVSLTNLAGYTILHRLFQSEVSKFHMALINTDPADRDSVIAAHTLAKAAAQFYVGAVNRVNKEIEMFRTNVTSNVPEPDVTEELINV